MNDSQNQTPETITLENIRRISLRTLIRLDMAQLKNLQEQADKALFSANIAKEWVDGAIQFKLWEESKTEGQD